MFSPKFEYFPTKPFKPETDIFDRGISFSESIAVNGWNSGKKTIFKALSVPNAGIRRKTMSHINTNKEKNFFLHLASYWELNPIEIKRITSSYVFGFKIVNRFHSTKYPMIARA